MAIFLENPIVFVGYSLSEKNIQSIFEGIISMLSDDNLKQLQERMIFLQRKISLDDDDIEISSEHFNLGSKRLTPTSVYANNYSIFYNTLIKKRRSFPISMLRVLKKGFYEFVATATPNEGVFIANLEDQNFSSEQPVVIIAKQQYFRVKELSDDWLTHIVMDSLPHTADNVLTHFCKLNSEYSGRLPCYRFYSELSNPPIEIYEQCKRYDFEKIISNSIRKEILKKNIANISQALELDTGTWAGNIALISEELFNEEHIILLKNLLTEKLTNDEISDFRYPSDVRRLIRLYDYLRYRDAVK